MARVRNMVKYSDFKKNIPFKFSYHIDVDWEYLPHWIERQQQELPRSLELNPDFQRGNVWTEEQQISYVEYKLRGGYGADVVFFNCAGWMDDFKGPFVCVDGLQRITSVLRFMNNEIPAFGYFNKDIQGRMPSEMSFSVYINNLSNYKDVLQWYVEMNTQGKPHTKEEIDKVRDMISEYD